MNYDALYGLFPVASNGRIGSPHVYVFDNWATMLRVRSCLNSLWFGVSVGFCG